MYLGSETNFRAALPHGHPTKCGRWAYAAWRVYEALFLPQYGARSCSAGMWVRGLLYLAPRVLRDVAEFWWWKLRMWWS